MNKAQFAERVGRSRQYVSRECRQGGLKGSLLGKMIDLDSDACTEWLARRDLTADEVALPQPKVNGNGKTQAKRRKPQPAHHGALPDARWVLDAGHVRDIQDLTIKQVAEHFGTSFQFQGWLDGMRKIVEIENRKMLMDERRGTLVRRELVKQTVFSAMESYHRRLLSDLPRTIAARTYAAAASGVPKEESEALIKELISGGLQRVKEEALRLLGNKVEDEREIEG